MKMKLVKLRRFDSKTQDAIITGSNTENGQ